MSDYAAHVLFGLSENATLRQRWVDDPMERLKRALAFDAANANRVAPVDLAAERRAQQSLGEYPGAIHASFERLASQRPH